MPACRFTPIDERTGDPFSIGTASGEVESVTVGDSRPTVVWNPWAERAAQMSDFGADAWPLMLCVESANLAGARVVLAPGDTHILRVAISVVKG